MLDWRGLISMIDTCTYRVVDKIAVEVRAGHHNDEPQWHSAVCHPLPQERASIIDLRNKRVMPMGVSVMLR